MKLKVLLFYVVETLHFMRSLQMESGYIFIKFTNTKLLEFIEVANIRKHELQFLAFLVGKTKIENFSVGR